MFLQGGTDLCAAYQATGALQFRADPRAGDVAKQVRVLATLLRLRKNAQLVAGSKESASNGGGKILPHSLPDAPAPPHASWSRAQSDRRESILPAWAKSQGRANWPPAPRSRHSSEASSVWPTRCRPLQSKRHYIFFSHIQSTSSSSYICAAAEPAAGHSLLLPLLLRPPLRRPPVAAAAPSLSRSSPIPGLALAAHRPPPLMPHCCCPSM